MVRVYSRKFAAEADRVFAAAYVVVCCANDVANTAMEDAIAALRKSPKYKNKVKYYAKMAREAYRLYERQLAANLSKRNVWQFWMDYADAYSEQNRDHVLKLRLAAKQLMDNHRIEDSEMLSYIAAADVLLTWSLINFDDYFASQAEKTGVNLSKYFSAARLSGVSKWWAELAGVLMKDVDIDFSADKRCGLAVACLATQLLSPANINKAGAEALKLHGELADEVEAMVE